MISPGRVRGAKHGNLLGAELQPARQRQPYGRQCLQRLQSGPRQHQFPRIAHRHLDLSIRGDRHPMAMVTAFNQGPARDLNKHTHPALRPQFAGGIQPGRRGSSAAHHHACHGHSSHHHTHTQSVHAASSGTPFLECKPGIFTELWSPGQSHLSSSRGLHPSSIFRLAIPHEIRVQGRAWAEFGCSAGTGTG
jgi:hypothetical protein